MYCELANVSTTNEGRLRFRLELHDSTGAILFFADGMRFDLESNQFFTGKAIKGGWVGELAGVGEYGRDGVAKALKALVKRTDGWDAQKRRDEREVVWGTKRESNLIGGSKFDE